MEESRNCVFVCNLDVTISDAVFVSYFRNYVSGVVLEPERRRPRIIRNEFGRSKGYGFVHFVDSLSAERVVSKKYHMIDGKKVICKLATSRNRNPAISRNLRITEPVHLRNLFVHNLIVSTTEQQLKNYFSNFTPDVVNVSIKFDENKKSTCYGFVTFKRSSSVNLVQDRRPHKINNQEIQTARCYPKNVPIHLKRSSTVLYILKYSGNIDKDAVEKYFNSFGNITFICHTVKRSGNIEYIEIHFVDYDDVDVICLSGDKHIISEYCTVIVSKLLDNDFLKRNNTQIETQHAIRPTVGYLELNNKDSNSFQSFPPSAPILSPVLSHQDLKQPTSNPYYNNCQQVPCSSFELHAINSQKMALPNNDSSFSRKPSREEDDCCQCCCIIL